ncbi:MAG TPA: cytochrome c [Methylomirabilota bacterium]|jgi:cytochrome c oxidase subunit 2|nr:cytochrome c [Methylomirabilota bacterium]
MPAGSLAPFFGATAVAVVGASADPSKVGGSVLAILRAGAALAVAAPELAELEINPLLAGPGGARARRARPAGARSAVMIRAIVLASLLVLAAAPAAGQDVRLVEAGAHVFAKQGCYGCHTIGKTGTVFAGDLSHVGARSSPDDLSRWLRDPAAVRPSAHMAALELSDDDIRALAAFLGAQR